MLMKLSPGETDPTSDLTIGNQATVAGWGKTTNDLQTFRKNFEEFKASTRFHAKIDHFDSLHLFMQWFHFSKCKLILG